MNPEIARIRQVLEKMRVQTENGAPPPIFVLGSFCSRVTFYSQQVRGLNSAYALVEGGIVGPGAEVAVIGAGAAGTAATVGLLAQGVGVTMIERNQEPFSRQRVCMHRELHPHIYDWPHPIALDPDANLPFLNWQAEDASRVVDDLTVQWDQLTSKARESGQLKLEMNSKLVSLKPDQRPRLSWQSNQRPQNDKTFDAVIVAVGFGEDQRKVFSRTYNSYWNVDEIETPGPKDILISGNGDGGLIDVVRCLMNKFRQRSIVVDFDLNNPDMEDTRRTLLRIEQEQRNAFHHDQMVSDYRRVIEGLPKRLKDRLNSPSFRRADRKLFFHTREADWLKLNTSILNRFLAFLVIDNNPAVTRLFGDVLDISAQENMGTTRYSVQIAHTDAINVDYIVIRWGAESEIDNSKVLSSAIGLHRNHFRTFGYNDPTIEPLWGSAADFQTEAEHINSKAASPRKRPPPYLPPSSTSPTAPLLTPAPPSAIAAPFGKLFYPGVDDAASHTDIHFASLQRISTPLHATAAPADTPPRIIWRAPIRGVLAEIEDMAKHLEDRVRLHVRARCGSDFSDATKQTQYLTNGFLSRLDQLHERLGSLARGYERFWQETQGIDGQQQMCGARSYAALANLYLLCWLYRFRGYIIDAEGGLVLRTFADAPARDQPIYTMPNLDRFAMDAFSQFNGLFPEFVDCKVVCQATGARESITLPKSLAYVYVGDNIPDGDLLHTWILPQWALRYETDLPVNGVSIDRIFDNRGTEWFSRHSKCPWENVEWNDPEEDGLVLGTSDFETFRYSVEERIVEVPGFSLSPPGKWYSLRGVWRKKA